MAGRARATGAIEMNTRSAMWVGAVVLIALGAFFALFLYLSHQDPNTYKVRVRLLDTRGLSKQSLVRMQGVNIGEVTDVQLDTSQPPFSPVATIAIKRKFNIPVDSHFGVVSGILISTPEVAVRPGTQSIFLPHDNTAIVTGDLPSSILATISPDLEVSVKELRTTVKSLDARLNVTFDKLNKTLDNTQPILKHTDQFILTARDAAASAKGLVADPSYKRQFQATLANFRKVSGDASEASSQLKDYVTSLTTKTKGPLEKLPSKLNDLLGHVDATLDNADAVVNKLTEQVTDPRFQQSLQETAELARTTLARFNQIATDLHELTGDPKLQTDLKLTVSNLRATTEKSEQVVDKFNSLLGKFVGGDAGPRPRIKLPTVELTGDISEQLSPTRLRMDVNARLGFGPRNEAYVGLYDLGQNTRLTLQAGTKLTDSLTARYGLYASKIGGGLDYRVNPSTELRADLWDTNRLRLDLRSSFRVNNNASIWLGADGIFRKPVPIIGVQLKN
jgi:phospholipid/cholesterol/gamma-HCH transport system substrate-binding protein